MHPLALPKPPIHPILGRSFPFWNVSISAVFARIPTFQYLPKAHFRLLFGRTRIEGFRQAVPEIFKFYWGTYLWCISRFPQEPLNRSLRQLDVRKATRKEYLPPPERDISTSSWPVLLPFRVFRIFDISHSEITQSSSSRHRFDSIRSPLHGRSRINSIGEAVLSQFAFFCGDSSLWALSHTLSFLGTPTSSYPLGFTPLDSGPIPGFLTCGTPALFISSACACVVALHICLLIED